LIGTMAAMEWTIELVLVVLLGATLFQAIRLERALGMLKRDRASLESLVIGFNASTHQAENGIQRLRAAADGAGKQIETQVAKSISLKDDLAFLTERGDRLADRLDTLVRAARPLARDRQAADAMTGRTEKPSPQSLGQPASKAVSQPTPRATPEATQGAAQGAPSQVERDLLQALRMAR
jgi:hypothetical protein